ncbi:MAG: Riboflavin transporter RfnT [Anaerolineae bacterium]|nr:Riboflavin transporter RfnT [Anaerolineae bacterium]
MSQLEKTSRRIVFTLLAGQSLFSAALIVAFTIASIIAVELGRSEGWTGVPSTLTVAGAALMAYPVGKLMDRAGRRVGLSVGYALGIVAALIAGAAVITGSLALFLAGIFLLGMTKGVLDQGRYAAAEASPARTRARAISWVVLGGTAGSILGPSLISSSGKLATQLGLPSLSGPWFVAALIFGLTLVLINIFLRPDPQQLGRQFAAIEPETEAGGSTGGRPYRDILQDPRIKLATAALISGQLAMVVVMTMTPVHMHHNHHELGPISLVIMAHTLGMFGLSFVTGWLVDRLGRNAIILAGGFVLAMACLTAPLNASALWLAVCLFLLGLGWNFCFVAGSALLSDALRASERGRVQGLTDTMINVISGVGSTGGGLIFAAFGYLTISWLSILISLAPVALLLLLRGTPSLQPGPVTLDG